MAKSFQWRFHQATWQNRYSFEVAKADQSLPIVIDPILQSTWEEVIGIMPTPLPFLQRAMSMLWDIPTPTTFLALLLGIRVEKIRAPLWQSCLLVVAEQVEVAEPVAVVEPVVAVVDVL